MLAGLRAKRVALAEVTAPADPAQAIKQVSSLFLDAVGSTTPRQRLDPEAIGAAMDDALSRGTAIVEAHRGKVLLCAGTISWPTSGWTKRAKTTPSAPCNAGWPCSNPARRSEPRVISMSAWGCAEPVDSPTESSP